MQILILGMHRSGTSLLARTLHELGLYCGEDNELLPAAPDNIFGFFERRDVKEVNDQLLQENGFSWNALVDFDPLELNFESIDKFKQQAFKIIKELNKNGSWFIKDPRCCLLYTHWLSLLQEAKIIFVYRHPSDIANSLKLRNNLPVSIGLALWEKYMRSLFLFARDEIIFVNFHNLINDCQNELSKLIKNLDLEIADELLANLSNQIKPHLVHKSAGHEMSMTLFQKNLAEKIEEQNVEKIVEFMTEFQPEHDDSILQLHGNHLDSISTIRELLKVEKDLRSENARLSRSLRSREAKLSDLSIQIDNLNIKKEHKTEISGINDSLTRIQKKALQNDTRIAALQITSEELMKRQNEILLSISNSTNFAKKILQVQSDVRNQMDQILEIKNIYDNLFKQVANQNQEFQHNIKQSMHTLKKEVAESQNQLKLLLSTNAKLVDLNSNLEEELQTATNERNQAIVKMNHEKRVLRKSISFRIGWILTRPFAALGYLIKK